MAFVPPRDRVLEYSTSNSQTVFAVTGAADASFNAFAASMAVGDTTLGGVIEPGVAFKSGILTYSATGQVTITTVKESKGTFSASGLKQVFMGQAALAALMVDGPQSLSAAQQGRGMANMGVVSAPQGRLTLTSGIPVMQTSVASATTIFYTPYGGNLVPIYDGAVLVMTQFAELSQTTADTTKSPAAVAASKVYDLFVWNDAGTVRCTRGPAWTNATTRGYTLTMVNGVLLNTSAVTNGPGALRGTYVGTVASNAGSTIDFIFGNTGAGGVAGAFNVWNAYNRVDVGCTVSDNGAGYVYASSTVRQSHGSAAYQVSFVQGLAEDAVSVSYVDFIAPPASGNFGQIGIGFDRTNAFDTKAFFAGSGANYANTPAAIGLWNSGIGSHFVAALQAGDGSNIVFAGSSIVGLSFRLRM